MSAISDKYAALGGAGGWLGPVQAPETPTPNGRGSFAHYRSGSIYHSPATGAHEVHGAIRAKWARLGWEQSVLGFPTNDESDALRGGRFNHFQGGSIYWSADTGAHEVHGAIHAQWRASGWERGPLGFPTTDEVAVPGGDGRWSRFERGQIYWTPQHGTRVETAPAVVRRPWVFILCQHADDITQPRPPAEFWNLFTEVGQGTEGIHDFFRDVTYGGISMEGSLVLGWHRLPHTLATDIQWRDTLPAPESRARRIDAGIRAAGTGFDFSRFDGICVILNGVVDSGSLGRAERTLNGRPQQLGLVVLDPGGWNPMIAAHEIGHGLGLPHTFADTSPPTEYGDPWDIMSADNNVHSHVGSRYGESGPSLCAGYRMRLGAIPTGRVYVTGLAGAATEQVTLAGIDSPHLAHPLVVKVPLHTPTGESERYLTVEVRRKLGWDRGIPDDVVLIHEVRRNTTTLIQTGGGPEFRHGETFTHASGVQITVVPLAAPVGTAAIAVTARP